MLNDVTKDVKKDFAHWFLIIFHFYTASSTRNPNLINILSRRGMASRKIENNKEAMCKMCETLCAFFQIGKNKNLWTWKKLIIT